MKSECVGCGGRLRRWYICKRATCVEVQIVVVVMVVVVVGGKGENRGRGRSGVRCWDSRGEEEGRVEELMIGVRGGVTEVVVVGEGGDI